MHRKLPRTFAGRFYTLRTAKRKIAKTPDKLWAVSSNTATRLLKLYSLFKAEYTERAAAFSIQGKASIEEDKVQEILEMTVSHFVQVFNFGVYRGIYHPSERKFFQLEIEDSHVPSINTEDSLLLWAENIIDGETPRLEAGGLPMTNPSVKEIMFARDNFLKVSDMQIEAKANFIREQEDVVKMFPEIDELIRDIWDEVEFYYRKEKPAHKRRQAREYGVVYESSIGEHVEEEVDEELLQS